MFWLLIGLVFATEEAGLAGLPTSVEDDEGAGGALPGGPDPALPALPPGMVLGPGGLILPANPSISAVERGPERWTVPPTVLDAVRAVATAPIGVRVEAASRAFLGLPYLNDAIGEFDPGDPDPPSRYDAFDCLTFVEDVLGLALAGDPLHGAGIRDALRYKGSQSYSTRRHFMESQWIPDAIANGLLEDITARVGHARVLRKAVTLDTWKRWGRRSIFRMPDALLPVGEWSLPYLDLAEAVAAAPRIPAGSLIVTLRAERAHKPIVVTHISMVVPPAEGAPADQTRMRHATRMGRRTVRDDRLSWYVAHLRDYTNWPALGITVLLPREQGPRISALDAPRLPAPFPPAEGPVPVLASVVPGGGGESPPATPPQTATAGDAAPSGAP